MMIVRFRSNEEHQDLLKKVKKMREYTEMLEECLEDAMHEEPEYRGGYRKSYDEEDMKAEGRYGYKRDYRRGM